MKSQRFGFVALSVLLLAILAIPAVVWSSGSEVKLQAGSTQGTVTLFWDANSEPDLAGYKVYWGRSPSVYTNTPQPVVAVMSQPSYTTPVLPNGKWYFAVTAFNAAGQESGFSNEVSTTISIAPAPPTGLRFTLAKLIAELWNLIAGR